MIPKIIHYCWFGGNPLPELALKCIESWKKYCPDYEIIEWNESNFDIDALQYTKEAYEAKKYAFVADVARLKALYEFGGIYMDTDMELLKNIDDLNNCDFYLGFERNTKVAFGICGAIKHSPIIHKLLLYYRDTHFDIKKMTTIVDNITDIFEDMGLKLNGKTQKIVNSVIYSIDYFYPKSVETNKINFTNNTCAIHHYEGSWLNDIQRFKKEKKFYYIDKFGKTFGKFAYLMHRFFYVLKTDGIGKTLLLVRKKIGF